MELTKSMMESSEEDKQVYEMDDDHKQTQVQILPPVTPKPEDETPLGDNYDLYNMTTKVHSPIPEMTKDFTLSDLSSSVINDKLPKFIREQLKIMKIIERYIVIPVEELEERYNPQDAIIIHNRLKKQAKDIKELLLNEIYSMVIMSRSVNGKILKAILTHGRTHEEREDYESSLKENNILGKLNEQKK